MMTEAIDPHRKRVVFIEDDDALPLIMERTARELAPHWNVVSAKSINEGIRLAAKGADLIILDLQLPDREIDETIDFIRWLKAIAPVVVLTGQALREQDRIGRCIANGASDVIAKLQLIGPGWGHFIQSCNASIAIA